MKKVFKKAILVLLVAVMVFGAAPLAGFVGLDLPEINLFTTKAEAATDGYYTYSIYNSEAKITDADTSISGDVTIPSILGGYPVTSIDDGAFQNCTSLVSIIIPNGVTKIGEYAFYGCTSLASVIIPNGVTEIGEYAFAGCYSLKGITIPESVTDIGKCAFRACDYMKNITVDSGNTAYSSDKNGVLFNKDKTVLICYPMGSSAKSFTIPDSVTTISDYAFGGTAVNDSGYSLRNVTIPDSVTSIGNGAFAVCKSLSSITIPDSVTDLGEYAFYCCTGLESIKIGRGITTLKQMAFAGCFLLKSIIIPDTVKFINAYAFYLSEADDVYYGGSKTEWENITIAAYNEALTSAKIHYNSTGHNGGSTDEPNNIPDYDSSVVDSSTVKTPTETKISYGDSIVLHVDSTKIPEGGYVKWYPSNNNFSYTVSADGTTCTISPSKSGTTSFTALVYDAEGNIVSADEQTMTSKAGFFDKLVAFFKKLFGATKIIPQATETVY